MPRIKHFDVIVILIIDVENHILRYSDWKFSLVTRPAFVAMKIAQSEFTTIVWSKNLPKRK